MEDSTMTKRNFYWQFTFVACLFAYPAILQSAEQGKRRHRPQQGDLRGMGS
jgi:hypothetical protein